VGERVTPVTIVQQPKNPGGTCWPVKYTEGGSTTGRRTVSVRTSVQYSKVGGVWCGEALALKPVRVRGEALLWEERVFSP
jgi:hypothetical protein